MATFEAQVAGLTSLTIDDSSSPTRAELNQFLTDAAKEIINVLPASLLKICSSQQTFTSGSADTLNTGKVLEVLRNDGDIEQPCRKINSFKRGRVSDSEDMDYATVTDPVYFIKNNTIDILPAGGSCKYSEVQYPTVSYTHEAISVFPDEAEYLVPLYAAVKSLQNAMGNMLTNTAIDTTAIALVKAAVDQAEIAVNKFESATESVFGDADTFDTAASQLTRVKSALNNAENVINSNQPSSTTDAFGAQSNEDTELVVSALNIAQAEIQRAQAHLSEWTSIGDMRVKEANAALSEANGYVSEINIRMSRDKQKYDWYMTQQAKLQQDYDKGIQFLRGQVGVS